MRAGGQLLQAGLGLGHGGEPRVEPVVTGVPDDDVPGGPTLGGGVASGPLGFGARHLQRPETILGTQAELVGDSLTELTMELGRACSSIDDDPHLPSGHPPGFRSTQGDRQLHVTQHAGGVIPDTGTDRGRLDPRPRTAQRLCGHRHPVAGDRVGARHVHHLGRGGNSNRKGGSRAPLVEHDRVVVQIEESSGLVVGVVQPTHLGTQGVDAGLLRHGPRVPAVTMLVAGLSHGVGEGLGQHGARCVHAESARSHTPMVDTAAVPPLPSQLATPRTTGAGSTPGAGRRARPQNDDNPPEGVPREGDPLRTTRPCGRGRRPPGPPQGGGGGCRPHSRGGPPAAPLRRW